MGSTYLRLETVTGRHPLQVFEDAERVATALGVVVRMKVNNVETVTCPGEAASDIYESWKNSVARGYDFASARTV